MHTANRLRALPTLNLLCWARRARPEMIHHGHICRSGPKVLADIAPESIGIAPIHFEIGAWDEIACQACPTGPHRAPGRNPPDLAALVPLATDFAASDFELTRVRVNLTVEVARNRPMWGDVGQARLASHACGPLPGTVAR